jgi:hypothetical protein
MSTYNITSAVTGLKYSMKQTAQGGAVFVKNAVVAYKLTSSAFTEITDIDYPSRHTYSVSSLTRSGSTATATTSITNSLVTGDSVTIAGANQTEYNGTFTITVTGGTTFTYAVSGTPATPATGTITAVGGKTTVPGAVYLDDYMFVQAITGEIYNSDNGDITSWGALNFITPEKEPSNAVAIAKSLNYLVAFKQWDTEAFDDAGLPAPGSPLAVVGSFYLKLGCAHADSIVEFDGGIVFMSKRDNLQRSREIHVLKGLTPKKISTPEVERILNGDDLATLYALYLSMAGHQFYVLTLKTSLITIAYDFNSGFWHQLSFLTAQSAQTLTGGNLTSSGLTATAILTAHGFADGDPVLMAGATPSGYNGTFNITRVDANTFTYPIASTLTSPATGTITATGYNESYFPVVAYATYNNLDLVLHESNGIIYSLEPTVFQDNGVPINVMMRLPNWDNGNQQVKMIVQIRAIGDRVDTDVLIRYYDDDYVTASSYRRQDLSTQKTKITRLGSTFSRAYELKHTDNTALRLEALDQQFIQGK